MAESRIGVTDRAEGTVIDIVGVIGRPEQLGDAGGEQGTSYARLAESIERIRAIAAPEVVVNIRSTGGDVHDALLIYDALKSLDARIVTRCYGYTASAATLIAQAASAGCREISSHGLYLIHCAESAAEGNARSLAAVKELLDRTDERLAALYAERSGRPAERFAALMNENDGRGRWLTPRETAERSMPSRWRRLLQRLERWLEGDGPSEEKRAAPVAERTLPSDAAADDRAVAAALQAAQQAACRTEVETPEDPSPEETPSLSPNELAYRQDAMNLRDGIGLDR